MMTALGVTLRKGFALCLVVPSLLLACASTDAIDDGDDSAEESEPDGPEEAGLDSAALTTTGVAQKVVYGKSRQGQELVAYKLVPPNPNGKKAFLTFGLHGFEDAFDHDGRALFTIAEKTVKHFDKTPAELKGWTVWIIPSANPDGMLLGKNNRREEAGSAYGRCVSNGQDLNRQFSTSKFDEHDALKALFERAAPSAALDFHGWYNCYYGDKRIGGYFADAFNARYTDKPSRYCYTAENGRMDCGSTRGGAFHAYSQIGDDLFAEWASSVKGVPSALVEYPAPDFDENGKYDTTFDEKLGFRRLRSHTVDILTSRTVVALSKLFARY